MSSSSNRSAKISSALVIIAVIVLVLVFSFSRSLGLSSTSAGQDEGSGALKSQSDSGSADKKDEPGSALERFMRQKLQASNLILEGLCTEDLQLVSEGSATLKKMSHEERWRVSSDMLYRRYSTEFVHAVEELQQEAVDNDMDGTSMAWVNVTMKCLKCHEWVRNTVLADSNR